MITEAEAFEFNVLSVMRALQNAPSPDIAKKSLIRHGWGPDDDIDRLFDEAKKRLKYDPNDEDAWKDRVLKLTEDDLEALVKIKD